MTLLADLRRFLAGDLERPDPDDRRVPLGLRAAGRDVACGWIRDDLLELRRVRFRRDGTVGGVVALPDLGMSGPTPPWLAIARTTGCPRLALLVESATPLRRACNFSAPPAVFQGALASRPEAIAGPLPPATTVAGFRHASRPVALLREGPAALHEAWAADAASHDLALLRVQDATLAALEAVLRDPSARDARHVVVESSTRVAVLPIEGDGAWGEPQLLAHPGTRAFGGLLDGLPGPVVLARLLGPRDSRETASLPDFHVRPPTSWPDHPSLLLAIR